MLTRIGLFLLTNIAVLFVLNIVLTVFGLDRGTSTGLIVMALVFGMGGAFISLLMSKMMAKWSTGAQVIDPANPANKTEAWLIETVRRQAKQAGIGMPEVAIFPAAEPNAFATGASRDSALVAVSQGLLEQMDADEVEAVVGHEMAHVANGDMLTMTLLQGVLNVFIIIFARIIGVMVDRALSGQREGSSVGIGYFLGNMVAQVVLGILASLVVSAFSRYREYRADEGGAKFAGRQKMIAALRRLQACHDMPAQLPSEMTAFGIRGGGVMEWFASHPPLEKRIAALEQSR